MMIVKMKWWMCALWLLAGTAKAQDEWQQLEARGEQAARTLSSLNKLKELQGRYLAAREEIFADEQAGMQARAKNFVSLYQQWIQGWYQVLDALQDGTYRSVDQAQRDLMSRIQAEDGLRFDMRREADGLSSLGARLLSVLDKAPPIDPGELPESQTVIQQLQAHIGKLKDSATALTQQTNASLASSADVDKLVRAVTSILLKKVAVKQGWASVASVIDDYQNLVVYESAIEPKLRELERLENDVDRAALFLKWYTASKLLKMARERCPAIRTEITAATVSSKWRKQATDRVDVLCRAMESHVSGLADLGLTPAQITAELNNNQRDRAAERCKASDPKINCEKAKDLSRLSPKTVQSLSDEQRELLERQWSEIFNER